MAPVSACRRNCAQKQSNCRPQDTDVNGAFKPALTVVQESVCDVNRSFYCHWRLFCVGRKSQRLQKRSGEKNNANRKTWKVSEFTLCTLFNFTHKDRKTSQTQEQRKTTKWSIIFPAAEQNISLIFIYVRASFKVLIFYMFMRGNGFNMYLKYAELQWWFYPSVLCTCTSLILWLHIEDALDTTLETPLNVKQSSISWKHELRN